MPNYEALEVIRQVAAAGKKREVIEIGSGNGYWTYMLRRQGVEVRAVDNMQSEYRTLWIGDTIVKDGERFLKDNNGARDAVLLLVYPVVGAGFTAKVLDAYKGDTICVAGTQNRNGYTAFRDRRIDEYMKAERLEFEKTVQVAMPSFAGKDEALFIFERQK